MSLSPEGRKAPVDIEAQRSELQRKLRLLEVNRKAYSEDAQGIIRRQRAAIEKLQADNVSMKNELDASGSESSVPNVASQQELLRLRETALVFTRKLEAEKKRLDTLDALIRQQEARALEKRRAMGGVNAAKDDTQYVTKQIKVLENKLENQLVKLNEAVNRNKRLRNDIDNLRKERVVFSQVCKKIERELHDKKRAMASVIDVTNIAYEARDQAMNEIAALRAQSDKEQSAFDAEFRSIGRLIDNDRKERELALKAEAEKIYTHGCVDDDKRKRSKGEWGTARDKKEKGLDVLEAPALLEEAFARIQAATGISHVEELVAAFIAAEDQNFSMFNYVNTLNQEAEKLEEQATELQQELEHQTGTGVSDDSRWTRLLGGLGEHIAETEARCTALSAKFSAATRTLEGLKAEVAEIFEETGCNTAATRELLGEGSCNDANLLQHLALIEQRCGEIVPLYVARLHAQPSVQAEPSEARTSFTVRTDFTLSQQGGVGSAHASQSLVNLELPSAADEFEASEDESENDEDERPLTREELALRTQRKLNQGQGRPAAGGGPSARVRAPRSRPR